MHSATLRRNCFYPKDDPHLFKPLIAELLYQVEYLLPADDNVYVNSNVAKAGGLQSQASRVKL